MHRLVLLLVLLSAAALVGCTGSSDQGATSSPVNGAGWQITDLGTLGGDESSASAINTGGQVVGWSHNGDGDQRAFLWEDGEMTDLGTLPRLGASWAVGINDAGQVIGGACNLDAWDGSCSATRAFLWEDGEMTDLGTLGGKETEAVAINERGQVVGQSETKGGYLHAFLWQEGEMIDLGSVNRRRNGPDCRPGLRYWESTAAAINDRGQIVGTASTDVRGVSGCGIGHAFLWENGALRDLGTFLGRENPNYPNSSSATDLNDHGHVVGSASIGYGSVHAVVWRAGTMTDLGTLAEARTDPRTYSEADAINNSGQIVGKSEATNGGSNGVLWQGNRIIDLDRPGDLFQVDSLNERGQVIGVSGEGYEALHGFLWQRGELTDLGTLPGGQDSFVRDINDLGQIVGSGAVEMNEEGHCTAPEPSIEVIACSHAVLWTLKR